MDRRAVTVIVSVALLGVLAASSALAPGAGTVEVKTGQKGNELRIGKSEAVGQLRTAGGNRKARKRCLKNRQVSLSGPAEVFQRSGSARAARALGSDRTNAKGEWSISSSPDLFFGRGRYVVKVKRKTAGGSKPGRQIIRCGSHQKKVTRGT